MVVGLPLRLDGKASNIELGMRERNCVFSPKNVMAGYLPPPPPRTPTPYVVYTLE